MTFSAIIRRVLLAVAVVAAIPAMAQAPDLSKMDLVERSTPDGPVAIINGLSISRNEFINTYQKHLAEVAMMTHDNNPSDEFRVKAGLTTLGELIRREILVQEAKKRGVTVPEADIEKAYKEKMDRFRQELKKPDGSAPGDEEILKIANQTRDEARDSLRRQLIEDKMASVIGKDAGIKIAEKDVREFYDKRPELFKNPNHIHLAQILIKPKGGQKADDAAWKTVTDAAEKARSRVLAGEKFEAVAKDVSQSPDAQKGGDLGPMPTAQLPPFFVEAAKTMKPGDVSPVIRSPYGAHIIRLIETTDSKNVPFEEAAPRIRLLLEKAKTEEAVDKFIEPTVNDHEKTKIGLQLDRTLASIEPAGETAQKPAENSKPQAATAKPAAKDSKPAAKPATKPATKPAAKKKAK